MYCACADSNLLMYLQTDTTFQSLQPLHRHNYWPYLCGWAALLEKMKPLQSLPLQMAERLRQAQPDSVANHVTARSISN